MAERQITKRRLGDQTKQRPLTAPRRTHYHRTLPAGIVKSPRLSSWRRNGFAERLPLGFMSAITEAFMRPCRIWDRTRNIRFVLEAFNQPESVLPTKIRQFLERFEAHD